MRRDTSDFLIVNGIQFPAPMRGMQIVRSYTVNAGRNANNAAVGQLVGRNPLWKIQGLQWNGLSAETWAMMVKALEPFYVPVTFTGDDNERHTVIMYPNDSKTEAFFLDGNKYKMYINCSFNLIDAGR